jgi:hypothetical protein
MSIASDPPSQLHRLFFSLPSSQSSPVFTMVATQPRKRTCTSTKEAKTMVKQQHRLRKWVAGAALSTVVWAAPTAAQITQVDPATLSGTQSVNFTGVAGGPSPGTNYDGLLVIDGVAFGERFAGQSVTTLGVFDELSGSPSGSLNLLAGTSGRNLAVFTTPAGAVLGGIGTLGFPAADALGEGAVSILFPTMQSEFGFRLAGGNGGSAFLSFYRADGSLIGSSTLSNLPVGVSNYGFVRTGGIADIAGISLWNNDVTGFGIGNVRFNVATGVPEPSTWAMMLMGFLAVGMGLRRRRFGLPGVQLG